MSEIAWGKLYAQLSLMDWIRKWREGDRPWDAIARHVTRLTEEPCTAADVEAAYREHGYDPDMDAEITQKAKGVAGGIAASEAAAALDQAGADQPELLADQVIGAIEPGEIDWERVYAANTGEALPLWSHLARWVRDSGPALTWGGLADAVRHLTGIPCSAEQVGEAFRRYYPDLVRVTPPPPASPATVTLDAQQVQTLAQCVQALAGLLKSIAPTGGQMPT